MEKKRGRPPKPDDERADERLEIRLTAAEKALWNAEAERESVTLAVWIRTKLNRAAKVKINR